MTDSAGHLNRAIEALYAAFADVPKPALIEGCPCCYEEKQVDVLLATPWREISPDLMARYAFSAFKTIGSEADYLYFLPRILEISCTVRAWWPEVEITGQAMAETKPHAWRRDRRLALENLLTAKISQCLALPAEEADWNADELSAWLCAADHMGLDLVPLLSLIENCPAAMVALYSHHAEKLEKGRLDNAFWEASLPGYSVMRAWFFAPPVRQALYARLGIVLPSEPV